MEIAAIVIYAIGFVFTVVAVSILMDDGYGGSVDSFDDFLDGFVRFLIGILTASVWPGLLAIFLALLALYGLFIVIRYPFRLLSKG